MTDPSNNNWDFASKMEQRLRTAAGLPGEGTFIKDVVIPEYDAFVKSLSEVQIEFAVAAQIGKAPDFAAQLNQAEIFAAVSGKFDPGVLSKIVEKESREGVLDALATKCIIDTNDKVEWLFKPDERKKVLNELIHSGQLISSTQKMLPDSDTFGKMLRRVIVAAQEVIPERLTRNELLDLSAVLETLRDIPIPQPDISSVKQLLQSASLLDDYQHLISSFIGREKELSALSAFLKKARGGQWQGCVIKGAGGSGKSSLLAKLSQNILAEKSAILVLLDFDKPGIDPSDTSWLVAEMARQIGIQFPASRALLKSNREETIRYQDELRFTSGHDPDGDGYHSLSKDLLFTIDQVIRSNKLPLLIILDTMEEVFQQNALRKLMRWIGDVNDILASHKIVIIFSGRIYEEISQLDGLTTIEVGAFNKTMSYRLLKTYGLNRSTSQKVINSGIVPLRPLELRLIAKILSEPHSSFEDLQREITEGLKAEISHELILGVIYKRVLSRIKDPVVQKIAYPGLILRYLNKDVILNVLQPVLMLPDLDDQEAGRILDELASHAWLAYRGAGDEVWHRKDLRRTMIRMMELDEGEIVGKIRARAIAYYQTKSDAGAFAEYMYHRLMDCRTVTAANELVITEIRSASDFIMSDIGDFPKYALPVFKFALNRELSFAELQILPDQYFKQAYAKAGRRLVSKQQFEQAFEIYDRGRDLGLTNKLKGPGPLDNWEQEMLFCLGDFKQLTYLSLSNGDIFLAKSLIDILNRVFPAAIAAPQAIDVDELDFQLARVVKDERSLRRILTGPDNITIITRLAYCFTIINYRSSLSDSLKRNLAVVLKSIEFGYKPGHVERSLMLLELISTGNILSSFRLGPSSLKFDAAWINDLRNYIPQASVSMIQPTITKLEMGAVKPVKARTLINSIDGSREYRKSWENTFINLDNLSRPDVFHLVRGPDTLFRLPVKFAVYEALKDGLSTDLLVHIIGPLLEVWISDLMSENLRAAMANHNADFLDPIIEVIDRSWALGEFLRALMLRWRETDKLNRLAEAYESWDASVRSLSVDLS